MDFIWIPSVFLLKPSLGARIQPRAPHCIYLSCSLAFKNLFGLHRCSGCFSIVRRALTSAPVELCNQAKGIFSEWPCLHRVFLQGPSSSVPVSFITGSDFPSAGKTLLWLQLAASAPWGELLCAKATFSFRLVMLVPNPAARPLPHFLPGPGPRLPRSPGPWPVSHCPRQRSSSVEPSPSPTVRVCPVDAPSLLSAWTRAV